jgi:glycosyltransferase involved in cell wall biosynthesis
MPQLTTILLNYNHAQFLPDSLRSLLAQTRKTDELIIIDDASNDNSIEVISGFLESCQNTRLIRNRANQGTVANMNDGLKLGQGTYIHFAAADDIFYPRLYESGMLLLETNPKASIFSSRSDIVDSTCRHIDPARPPLGYPLLAPGFISPEEAQRFLMREDGWFMGNTTLFRRAVVIEEGGFPADLQAFADGYISRLLALKYGSCFSPDTLAAWRRLATGYSVSIVESSAKANLMFANAEQRMRAADSVFPPQYVTRWKARQRFDLGLRKLARFRRRYEASGLIKRAIGAMTEKIGAVVLFLMLRPWDLAAVIRKRILPDRSRN